LVESRQSRLSGHPVVTRTAVNDNAAHPLAAWGFDDRVRAHVDLLDKPHAEVARVVRADRGGVCFVVTAEGARQASADTTASRQAGVDEWPVTGDWVVLDGDAVVGIAHRWSRIARQDPSDPRAEQVLVANVDRMLCVQALDRPVSVRRLERLVAVAWDGAVHPTVLLTKADLSDDPQVAAREVAGAMLEVDVLVVSARSGMGVAEVEQAVRGATVALVGPSGAGKSTLVNRLAGETVRAVADVRGDAKGRHTTTSRELVALPHGGVLVDTPGLRAVGVGIAVDGVAAAFADIEDLAPECRFRDCRHESEPGCAVQAAVAGGALDAERVESYLRLRREAESAELRADPARSRAASRRFGRMVRDVTHRDRPGA
jgi:ribosome biogenesis GTPase